MSIKVSLNLSGDISALASFNIPDVPYNTVDEISGGTLVTGTNKQFNIFFPVTSTKLGLLMLVADQDTEVQFNSQSGLPGTGPTIIQLKAGIPFAWYQGAGWSLTGLLGSSANVTSVYARSIGAPQSNLPISGFNLVAKYDPTP
jgi:hypothetical protein